MCVSEKTRRFACLCAVLASAWVGSTPAFAQPSGARGADTAKARAADLVNNATAAYRNGDFQQAVNLLKQAYELDPQPVLLFNLGRAYEGLGDIDSAIDALSQYIAADPKAGDRGAIEQRIGTLKRQRDERIALQAQRDAEKKRADEEARAAQARQSAPPPRQRSVVPWILVGVGVAGLGTGTVFGLLSRSKHDHATKLSTDQVTAVHDQDTAKTFATVSTASFVAGGVLTAVGVTWWIVTREPSTSPPAKASTGPTLRIGFAPGAVTLGGEL